MRQLLKKPRKNEVDDFKAFIRRAMDLKNGPVEISGSGLQSTGNLVTDLRIIEAITGETCSDRLIRQDHD